MIALRFWHRIGNSQWICQLCGTFSMPFQISETTWWLLLGVLLGLFLFWLIDKLYRRDGDYAAQRERREIASLKQQASELREENTTSQKRLNERAAEVKRLNTLSEEMRDSIRGKEQQVTNLETALAAAREQQAEVEPLRAEVAQLTEKKSLLESEVEKGKQAEQSLTKVQSEAQAKDKRIDELTTQLGNTTQSYEKTLDELRADHARALGGKDNELSDLKSKLASAQASSSSTSSTGGIAAAATGAAAATIASVSSGSSAKDETPVVEPKPEPTLKKEPATRSPATGGSSLASRHSDNATPTKPESTNGKDAEQRGLLVRLRGAFSGRRPDDLD
jgi:ABC-type multidrug transport system fused ATPase/permease subunit